MKIILNEDVYNLGEEGDVREVAPGYARNYLIPKGFAVAFTKRNIAHFQGRRKSIEARKEEKRDVALGMKERIEALSFVIEMPAGESGKLFGSVSNSTIAERLEGEGIAVERKKIDIPGHSIKMVGKHTVLVKLYADQSASLSVEIVQTEGSKTPNQKRQTKAKPVEKKGEPAEKQAEAKPEKTDDDKSTTDKGKAAKAKTETGEVTAKAEASTEDATAKKADAGSESESKKAEEEPEKIVDETTTDKGKAGKAKAPSGKDAVEPEAGAEESAVKDADESGEEPADAKAATESGEESSE